MKKLIVFATRHGCAEKCANKLKEKLGEDTDVVNLKHRSKIDIDEYSTVIIGGSIHAGMVQKRIKKFCSRNADTLLKKKLGLFLCCMEEGDKAEAQFKNAFTEELINHATATGILGGEFDFGKMNFIESLIVKKVAKVEKSVSRFSEENISRFADKLS